MIEKESKTALMRRRERATGCGNMGTREGRVEVKGLTLCYIRDVGNNNNNNNNY
jgi:hypothetical protein